MNQRVEPWQQAEIKKDWEIFASELNLKGEWSSPDMWWGRGDYSFTKQGSFYEINLKVERVRVPHITETISQAKCDVYSLPPSNDYEGKVKLSVSIFPEKIIKIPSFEWTLDDPYCGAWYGRKEEFEESNEAQQKIKAILDEIWPLLKRVNKLSEVKL